MQDMFFCMSLDLPSDLFDGGGPPKGLIWRSLEKKLQIGHWEKEADSPFNRKPFGATPRVAQPQKLDMHVLEEETIYQNYPKQIG